MILQQLVRDSDRLVPDMPPPMYNVGRVRWTIVLQADGTFEGFVKTEGEGKKGAQGVERMAPAVKRTVAILPILYSDTPAYTLNLGDDKRVAEKFAAYKAKIALCAKETGEPAVMAVSQFLQQYDPATCPPPDDMAPADRITFRVDGTYPMDLPGVRKFWAANAREAGGVAAAGAQCLVCGATDGDILDRHPTPIKGLPNGQMSGTALVAINSDAFESYGLDAAFSAPTCASCGERYAKALNALIAGKDTHLRIGPAVFVFWASIGSDSPIPNLQNPNPDEVRDLLASYRKGIKRAKLEPADFYVTSLSANSARAVVRDWLHTTVGAAQDRLAEWFLRLELVDEWGQTGKPLGLYTLAAALYRDANKEMVAQTPRLLLRAALYGDPLPDTLLAQAIRRNRAERKVPYSRAALMKAILLSGASDPKEWNRMSKLDPAQDRPAYHCGRLLAELETLQQSAIRGINTTLVDRFYGAASTAPASVFGTLLKGAQPHLSVLRRTNEPAFRGVQKRLEEILAELTVFPPTLPLKEQAYFGLGYYHQRAQHKAEIAAAAQAKRDRSDAAQAADTDATSESLPEETA